MRSSFLLVAALAVALPLTAQELRRSAEPEILARLGLPAGFVGEVEVRSNLFKVLGVTVTQAKATDPITGEVISAAWDESGRAVDFSAVRQREIDMRRATPVAKIRPELLEAMREDGGRFHPVIVWLEFPAAEWDRVVQSFVSKIDDTTMTREECEALEEQAGAYIMAQSSALTEAAGAEFASLGAQVRYISNGTPMVSVYATKEQVHALSALPRVDTLYLEDASAQDYNEDANASHRTDRVHQKGVKGRGVDVAILEDNRISESHPYLNVTAWFNLAGSGPDDHVQGTSGNIASQYVGRIGAAPEANLYSANAASYSDTNVTAAADWVTTTSTIDITNNSWGPTSPTGVLQYSDRLFDYKSRFFADSYFGAAGNSGLAGLCGRIGWNIVTVGSFADGEDGGDWDGDAMSSFSSAGNPTTGCEKPNVTANGDSVDTLGDGTTGAGQPVAWLYDDYDGTSFSSPHAAGNLANAMSVDVTLSTPEAAMALLMATAWHNIEGSTRLSSQDGAGAIHGLALVNAAKDNQAATAFLNPASFTATSYYTYNVFLQGDDRVRICIAWSSNAAASYATDVLDADLDLAIYAGQDVIAGTSLASSASFNNNYEIVEFTPNDTGWYTIRINDFRFDGASETVGIAWSQKTSDGSSFRLRPRSASFAGVTQLGPTTGTGYWMDINAPYSPGELWLTSPGVLGADGYRFSAQTWSPIAFDLFTLLWLDNLTTGIWGWLGYTGNTTSDGNGHTNRLNPIWPGVEGFNVTHIGYIVDPDYPDTIREISEPLTTTFWPTGTVQVHSDDTSVEVPLPFSFPFYGVNYGSCFVNSNGNLTFGTGDTDFSESEAEMQADQPRIALFWDDLNVTINGSIVQRSVTVNNRVVVIDYVDVAQFGSTAATDFNTGRVELSPDGTIRLSWRNCSLQDCIAGISPGGNLSLTASRDISTFGYTTVFGAFFESFTASNPLDLDHPGVPNFTGLWYNTMTLTPSGSGYYVTMEIDQ